MKLYCRRRRNSCFQDYRYAIWNLERQVDVGFVSPRGYGNGVPSIGSQTTTVGINVICNNFRAEPTPL
jgi:hypothetical protein